MVAGRPPAIRPVVEEKPRRQHRHEMGRQRRSRDDAGVVPRMASKPGLLCRCATLRRSLNRRRPLAGGLQFPAFPCPHFDSCLMMRKLSMTNFPTTVKVGLT